MKFKKKKKITTGVTKVVNIYRYKKNQRITSVLGYEDQKID